MIICVTGSGATVNAGDKVQLAVEPDGAVRVTVTGEAGPAVTVTVSAIVDWRTFCRQAWPIVQSYTPAHRDGLMDLLPPAEE